MRIYARQTGRRAEQEALIKDFKDKEAEAAAKTKKEDEDLEKLLDEIDEVLEQNAEEFVRNYKQKGGQ